MILRIKNKKVLNNLRKKKGGSGGLIKSVGQIASHFIRLTTQPIQTGLCFTKGASRFHYRLIAPKRLALIKNVIAPIVTLTFIYLFTLFLNENKTS